MAGCRAEELKDKICKYGEVRDCYLPRDFHTGRPRGFGFVEFAGDRRDAEDAIRGLDGSSFRGREITVCFSREVHTLAIAPTRVSESQFYPRII